MVWKTTKLYTTSLTKRKRGDFSPLHTRAYTRVRVNSEVALWISATPRKPYGLHEQFEHLN